MDQSCQDVEDQDCSKRINVQKRTQYSNEYPLLIDDKKTRLRRYSQSRYIEECLHSTLMFIPASPTRRSLAICIVTVPSSSLAPLPQR